MRVALVLLAVLAIVGAAHADGMFENVPASVTQQRSLLSTSGPPPPYYAGNLKAAAKIYLLIRPKKGVTLNAAKYGLAHFNARIKPTLRKFNKAYPTAHLNFRAAYVSGPQFIIGPAQAWLTYSFNVDVGAPGAPFYKALRAELRSALRKKSAYVRVTRGNIA